MMLRALATVLSACSADQGRRQESAPKLTSEYQAVLLTNGQVLIGKLEGLGTPFPVLTDVYYVQAVVDPQTKQTRNVLVKRGKEWHAPDRTILNANHIIIVEPVTKGSKVMDLIEKAKPE
jgi:hypothetical protein